MCGGLATNVIFGMLFATGVSTTVSYRVANISQWFPGSVERLWPMLQAMRRFGEDTFVGLGYLALSTIVSIVLVVGLWNMKKWAAWVLTALMLYTLAANTYTIIRLANVGLLNSKEIITLGWLPALAWPSSYVVLLWPDRIIGGLRKGANVAKRLRPERIRL